MFNEMQVSGGGGSTGYFNTDTASTSGKTYDLGFIPSMVLIYIKYPYSGRNYIETYRYDCSDNKIYQTDESSRFESDNTSYWSQYYQVNGTQVYFRAPDSVYASNMCIMAY